MVRSTGSDMRMDGAAAAGELPEEVVDAHVRLMVRMRRKALGLSDAALAEAAGVPLAELRAYERGAARMPPSRLWRVARVLGCSLDDLFAGLDGAIAAKPFAGRKGR